MYGDREIPCKHAVTPATAVPGVEGAVAVADAHPAPGHDEETEDDQTLVDLLPMVRKVVGARIRDPQTVEDLVQETLRGW